ncbi:MAG: hypothetical protein ACI8ZM_001377 [Crocinitomix sp.]|jgi:hypothetical protein
MIKDLKIPEKELAKYMSKLSELAFTANWMDGLEFALWKGMRGDISEFGRLVFDKTIRDQLTQLSNNANGWIRFDNKQEEIFVSFQDWERIFKS